MADITDLLNYYVNLLIIQYHNQPKAQATINLFAETFLASGIFTDIQNAYNIDTAVGKQLDVLGKYAGVDRFYSELELTDYFSLITYAETTSLPTSPPRFGLSTYATYDDFAYNGTLQYSDIIATDNALFDDDFRTLIKLKIIQNTSNYSYGSIQRELFDLFGTTIRMESTGGMHMVYFVTAAVTSLIQAIIAKDLLPVPMGVGASIVEGITGLMFGLTDYSGSESPYAYGLAEYSDYDTLNGQVLTYDMITEA